MSDEPEASPSGGQFLPVGPPERGEKPRPGQRKRASPKPQALPSTEAGARVADQVRVKLIEMVDAAANVVAKRRRATALDATDYETGFDMIVGPAKRMTVVAIVADLAGAMGSGLIGYAINIYTDNGQDMPKGHLAMLCGAVLVAFSIALKNAAHGRGS